MSGGLPGGAFIYNQQQTRARTLAEAMKRRQEAIEAAVGQSGIDANIPRATQVIPSWSPTTQMGEDLVAQQQQQQQPGAQSWSPTTGMGQRMVEQSNIDVPDENLGDEEAGLEDDWTATGKTDTFGSWFNKRSSSDALTAFGAAMLKAPNFLEGLGDGALAVNKVEREYRMPTKQEIARANMKARIESGKGTYAPKVISQGYDANNNFVTLWQKPDGSRVVLDAGGNEMPAGTQIEGFVRAQDSGEGKLGDLAAKTLQADLDAVKVAYDSKDDLDEMSRLANGANIGPGWPEQTARFLSTISGVNFGGTDLAQMQEFQKISKNGELLKAMEQRGLGQFTEMERKIVQEALVTINTDPTAAKSIIEVMQIRNDRQIEMMSDWEAVGLSPNQYNAWKIRWMRQWREKNGSVYSGLLGKTTDSPDTSKKTITDEADAIVNGM